MQRIFSLLFTSFFVIALSACGGGGGDLSPSDLDPGTSNPETQPLPPAELSLSSSLLLGTTLSQGGETTISAHVKDASAQSVKDGTVVSFSSTLGSITAVTTTSSGLATATFQAGSAGGVVTITATAGNVSETISVKISAGPAASIVKESVTPITIGIVGSGIEDTSQIRFTVRDAKGASVEDGTLVNFTIRTPLGGGEKLSATSATTAGGSVTVALQSGTAPGTVAVAASITAADNTIVSSEARVTIVSNRPDADRITLAASTLNLGGGVTLGLQSTISAYLGDRAGNVVPDGTPVSFITECGTIGYSTGFTTTTNLGVASAVLQTSAPTVPDLGGIGNSGNVGLCRVVAYTPGKATFLDMNGNGVYDDGVDVCTPLVEPYIDANDNNQFDSGEYFVDVNKDGLFTSNIGCSDESMVWASMNVLISDHVGPMNLTPTNFNIPIGGSQTFTVDFQDLYGNALVAGTTFKVTTTAGTLAGATEFTQADTNGSGQQISFSLIASKKADAEPEFAEIRVTIGSAPGTNNNGATVFTFASGTINSP